MGSKARCSQSSPSLRTALHRQAGETGASLRLGLLAGFPPQLQPLSLQPAVQSHGNLPATLGVPRPKVTLLLSQPKPNPIPREMLKNTELNKVLPTGTIMDHFRKTNCYKFYEGNLTTYIKFSSGHIC